MASTTSAPDQSSDSDVSPMTQVPYSKADVPSSSASTAKALGYFPERSGSAKASNCFPEHSDSTKAKGFPEHSGSTKAKGFPEHSGSTSEEAAGTCRRAFGSSETSSSSTTSVAVAAATSATVAITEASTNANASTTTHAVATNTLATTRNTPATTAALEPACSDPTSRKSSTTSVSFCPLRDPLLPQGRPKERMRSPSPDRFRQHVGFDNIPVGEATKTNTLSYTLSISHHGYHPRRLSRTLMVGIDHNVYSEHALQWLLEEYAEDGDNVICVHVTDKDPRVVEEKNYKARADEMVARIKSKIPQDRAISIKLEYAVGKLHDTFHRLIHVYEPSMLVVGTKGRSLDGFQGLVNGSSSFSKYCLQYSPVPTVVVRDYDQRQQKKEKRTNDPGRRSYIAMLAANNGVHEADSDTSSLYEMEAHASRDEEAHKVAAAIGLPAAFDPTVKPMPGFDAALGGHRSRGGSREGSRQASPGPATVVASASHRPEQPSTAAASASATAGAEKEAVMSGDSDEEDSADEDEPEFEAVPGHVALQTTAESSQQRQQKLHLMEVGEAAALKTTLDSDDEECEPARAEGNAKKSSPSTGSSSKA